MRSVDELVLLGEALLIDDEIDDAVLAFLQAVRLDPSNRNAALGLAHATLAHGDLWGAVNQFSELLARDPNDLAAQAGLLECLDVHPIARTARAESPAT